MQSLNNAVGKTMQDCHTAVYQCLRRATKALIFAQKVGDGLGDSLSLLWTGVCSLLPLFSPVVLIWMKKSNFIVPALKRKTNKEKNYLKKSITGTLVTEGSHWSTSLIWPRLRAGCLSWRNPQHLASLGSATRNIPTYASLWLGLSHDTLLLWHLLLPT